MLKIKLRLHKKRSHVYGEDGKKWASCARLVRQWPVLKNASTEGESRKHPRLPPCARYLIGKTAIPHYKKTTIMPALASAA